MDLVVLRPWTLMFGFAYNESESEKEKRLEFFLGLFALSFVWLKE